MGWEERMGSGEMGFTYFIFEVRKWTDLGSRVVLLFWGLDGRGQINASCTLSG